MKKNSAAFRVNKKFLKNGILHGYRVGCELPRNRDANFLWNKNRTLNLRILHFFTTKKMGKVVVILVVFYLGFGESQVMGILKSLQFLVCLIIIGIFPGPKGRGGIVFSGDVVSEILRGMMPSRFWHLSPWTSVSPRTPLVGKSHNFFNIQSPATIWPTPWGVSQKIGVFHPQIYTILMMFFP